MMENLEGSFCFDENTTLFIHNSVSSMAGKGVTFFTETIQPSTGITLQTVKRRPTTRAIILDKDKSLPAEGYTLAVSENLIQIGANDPAGFFYAFQTLLQLFPPYVYSPVYQPDQYFPAHKVTLPCVRIKDYPRFSYRGMMLDVSRQFYTVDFVKKYLNWMAAHKLNRFHWHLSDDTGWRVEIKKYPELTTQGAWRGPNEVIPSSYGHAGIRYGGFYTQDEIREIVAYAADRNIEIIPEIDLPGHSKAIIATYPQILCDLTEEVELSIQGVSNNVWCASYEKNYEMLEDIIAEMVQLFPSPFFHIGGDEVVVNQWASCTRCTQFMKENDLKEPIEMQSYFVRRMQQILNKFGKTMVGWNEIMDGGELDREKTVIHAWQNEKKIKEAAQRGYMLIAQPANYCYLDMKHTLAERGMTWASITEVDKVYSFDPIVTAGLTEEESSKVLGVQGGLWSELLNTPPRIAEYQTYPRLAALSETAWSPGESKDWDCFNTRLGETHFERLYYMGIRFRIPPPSVDYVNGYICAANVYPWMTLRYTRDGSDPTPRSTLYQGPIQTDVPGQYRFAAFFKDNIKSLTVRAHLPESRYLRPPVKVSGNIMVNPRTPLSNLADYNPSTYSFCFGPPKEGQYVQFDFEELVHSSGIQVQTGLTFVNIDIVDFAHIEYSTDGVHFERAASLWNNGGCYFIPPTPFLSLRLVFDKGNETLIYYLQDLQIEK